jgi:hypothetical protein
MYNFDKNKNVTRNPNMTIMMMISILQEIIMETMLLLQYIPRELPEPFVEEVPILT